MFSSMPSSSITPDERSRKIAAAVLRALTESKQVAISTVTGLSETQISRMKNDQLENWAQLLAYAGLQVVAADEVVVDMLTYQAIAHIATEAMSNPDIAGLLLFPSPK